MRVVDDPVDDGNCHLVLCEELAPVGKVLVRGQHDRAVLVEAVQGSTPLLRTQLERFIMRN